MGLGSSIAMSFGVDFRHNLDLVLLWLWFRLAATALTGPLAWEPPYAMGAALKRQNFKKWAKNLGIPVVAQQKQI